MLLSFLLFVSKRASKGILVYTDSSQLLEEILELQNWWWLGKSTSHLRTSKILWHPDFWIWNQYRRKLILVQKTLDNWMPKAGDRTSDPKSFVFVKNLEFTSSMTSWMTSWMSSPHYSSEFCSRLFVKSNTNNWCL